MIQKEADCSRQFSDNVAHDYHGRDLPDDGIVDGPPVAGGAARVALSVDQDNIVQGGLPEGVHCAASADAQQTEGGRGSGHCDHCEAVNVGYVVGTGDHHEPGLEEA